MKTNYKKQLPLIFLLFALLAIVVSGCTPSLNAAGNTADSGAVQTSTNTITVLGTGEAAGPPDEAYVNLGVETFDQSVEAATSNNEATIQEILNTLKEQGIAPKDIQTSNYSLWAEQHYGDNGPEGIAGYHVSNQVNVTIRDIDKVADILSAAIDAGANSIYGVTFSVAEPDALEAEARADAIANARERAQSLADLSGVTLGDVQSITETFSQSPYPMMGMGGGASMAAAESAISPGQQSYQVQVQVTFGME